MKVDVYKRSEHNGYFSYLAVPEGKRIPEEAINTDWSIEARGMEVADDEAAMNDYQIQQPWNQISNKGYAITSVARIGMPGRR